jgi:hypothetical protein
MGKSTVVVIWLALAALALRPIEGVDRAARLVFEPARVLARVAAPFTWGSSAQASSDGEARARVRELLLAEQEDARPAERSLLAGRGLVHAQVIDRKEEQADLVVVRFPLEASIEPGMPVVCGDAYVGSVVEVGRAPPRKANALAPGEARVRLVTAKDARVGARAGAVELVAGGLARAGHSRARPRLLSVRALQREPGPERDVFIHEDAAAGGEWSTLAEGYRLGTLVVQPVGTRTTWAIEPLLDYRSGFSQVFVLCPPERAPAGALLAQDPFDARAWQPVRAALDGALSAWRETRRLFSGTRAGLCEGGAVARGTEFVGRIARADFLSSDVECLGDPGFRLLALASVPDRRAPLHLGRVLSLGCDTSRGIVYLAWEESAELARELAGLPRPAQLYTSSGERGIPPGLHLGAAELPAGAGPHVLVLRRSAAGTWGTQLEAWIGERAEAHGP